MKKLEMEYVKKIKEGLINGNQVAARNIGNVHNEEE